MDHVDLLGRADQARRHRLFVRDEQMLIDQCATLRHSQATKAVDYWIQLADGESGESTITPAPSTSQLPVSTLVEMATRSASTPADAQRPKPLFTVLVGDDTTRVLCPGGHRFGTPPPEATQLVGRGMNSRNDPTAASTSAATASPAASGQVPATDTMLATWSVAATYTSR